MGTSTQQQSTQSQTSPWTPQANQLTNAFNNADNAYAQSSNAQGLLPTQFTAGMTPTQLQDYSNLASNAASILSPSTTGVTTGANAQNAGVAGATGALNTLDAWNPNATNNANTVLGTAQQYVNGLNIPGQVQAAMQSANEEARDVTLPGMESNAASTGNINGSRTGLSEGIVQRGLAEQAGNLSAQLQNDAYNTGTTLGENIASTNNAQQEGALSAALSGGTGLSSSGAIQQQGGVSNMSNVEQALLTGASGAQTNQQLADTNALQNYQAQTQAPFAPLDQLMQIIGSNNWGSNSSSNSTTTSTPSTMSMIGSGLGAAGSLLGSFGGLGGSQGILGLLNAFNLMPGSSGGGLSLGK